MKLAFDLDNTFTKTIEKYHEYEVKYANDNNIMIDEIWLYDCYASEFLSTYLKKIYQEVDITEDALQVVKNLQKKGWKLYVITARELTYVPDLMDVVIKFLQRIDLEVDGIYIDHKVKSEVCKEIKANIFVDDNILYYNDCINNNVNVYLFDKNNKHPEVEKRVTNWKEFEKICDKLAKNG